MLILYLRSLAHSLLVPISYLHHTQLTGTPSVAQKSKASQVLISGPQGLLFGLLGSHPGGLISSTFIFTPWAYLWPPPRPTVGLVACLVCSLISKCLFAHCELLSAYSLNFLIIFHSLFIITPSYTSVCFCVAYLELIQALNFKFRLKPQLISK